MGQRYEPEPIGRPKWDEVIAARAKAAGAPTADAKDPILPKAGKPDGA